MEKIIEIISTLLKDPSVIVAIGALLAFWPYLFLLSQLLLSKAGIYSEDDLIAFSPRFKGITKTLYRQSITALLIYIPLFVVGILGFRYDFCRDITRLLHLKN